MSSASMSHQIDRREILLCSLEQAIGLPQPCPVKGIANRARIGEMLQFHPQPDVLAESFFGLRLKR